MPDAADALLHGTLTAALGFGIALAAEAFGVRFFRHRADRLCFPFILFIVATSQNAGHAGHAPALWMIGGFLVAIAGAGAIRRIAR